MPLERSDIVTKDFPVERRGYAPEAVQRHLETVASEVQELRSAQPATESPRGLAGAASERVQAIIDAAEQTAAEIEREARADAQRFREEASNDANQRVSEVRDSASALRERIDGLQGELSSLFEDMRTGAVRLTTSLDSLDDDVAVVRSKAPQVAAREQPERATEDAPAEETTGQETGDEDGAALGEDVQNARLVALNMALNGASRSETQRYLAENFTLDDPDTLLDDVYAQRGS